MNILSMNSGNIAPKMELEIPNVATKDGDSTLNKKKASKSKYRPGTLHYIIESETSVPSEEEDLTT